MIMAGSIKRFDRLYKNIRIGYDHSYREEADAGHPAAVPLARGQRRLPLGRVPPACERHQERQPFLTDGRPIGAAGFRVLQYQPLAAFPGLFRVFADTEPSRDGIKAFADRFGPLGGDIAKQIPLYDQPQRQGVAVGIGEPLRHGTIRF